MSTREYLVSTPRADRCRVGGAGIVTSARPKSCQVSRSSSNRWTRTCHAPCSVHLSYRTQRTPVMQHATRTCHATCNAHPPCSMRRTMAQWRTGARRTGQTVGLASAAAHASACACAHTREYAPALQSSFQDAPAPVGLRWSRGTRRYSLVLTELVVVGCAGASSTDAPRHVQEHHVLILWAPPLPHPPPPDTPSPRAFPSCPAGPLARGRLRARAFS